MWVILMLFLAVSIYGVSVPLIDKSSACRIIEHSYIQKLIDYKCQYINDTQFILKWKLKDETQFNNLAYKSTDNMSYKSVKEKYLKNADDDKLKFDLSLVKLNGMPKKIIKGNISVHGTINPFIRKEGKINITLLDGLNRANGATLKIGFESLLVTFNNSLSSENLTFHDDNEIIRYIRIGKYTYVNSAHITLTGFEGDNYCYEENATQQICSGITNSSYGFHDNYNDDNWSSYISSQPSMTVWHYFNYTKPKNATGMKIAYKFTTEKGDCFYYSGNATVPATCFNLYKDQVNFILKLQCYSKCNSNIYCYNGSPTHEPVIQTGLYSSDDCGMHYAYDESVIWINKSYPLNVSMDVGTPDGVYEFFQKGTFDTSNQTEDFSLEINNALNDGNCNCTGCSLYENFCDIPVRFYSRSGGLVEYKNLNISNQTSSNLTVILLDADTKTNITNTNITVQGIGNMFQFENITDTSRVYFSFFFNTTRSDLLSIRAFSTYNNDYNMVIRRFNMTRGETKTVTLYLTNTSDVDRTNIVTFHVTDENRDSLEGAILTILRQDPSTNTYLTITQMRTNANGEASTILRTDTAFYKYIVEYERSIIYSSRYPSTISINDDDIYLIGVLERTYSDYYDSLVGVDVSVNYTKISNTSGKFKMSFSGLNTVDGCLKIYVSNITGMSLIEVNCLNSTAGDIESGLLNPTNRTLYMAIGVINSFDGEGYKYGDGLLQYIGENKQTLTSLEGIILVLAVLSVSAFGFIKNSIMGLIMFSIGMLIIPLTGWVPQVTMGISMLIVSLSIISMFVVGKYET